MKLPTPPRNLLRDLKEFDIWITPSLGEITDTDKFKVELARVTRIFKELGLATGNFQDEKHCAPEAIAQTFVRLASDQTEAERAELFKSSASTLYLVTGKSDNNSKCQFPLFLRDVARWDAIPSLDRTLLKLTKNDILYTPIFTNIIAIKNAILNNYILYL